MKNPEQEYKNPEQDYCDRCGRRFPTNAYGAVLALREYSNPRLLGKGKYMLVCAKCLDYLRKTEG